jgi:hypothetical protein
MMITSELPRTPATLLFRLLGAGRALDDALTELDQLGPEDPLRSAATLVMVDLLLDKDARKTTIDEESLMQTLERYEKWRKEVRAEGEAMAKAAAVLAVLQARGIDLDEVSVARIRGTTDLSPLDAWLVRAATAETLGQVFEG